MQIMKLCTFKHLGASCSSSRSFIISSSIKIVEHLRQSSWSYLCEVSASVLKEYEESTRISIVNKSDAYEFLFDFCSNWPR